MSNKFLTLISIVILFVGLMGCSASAFDPPSYDPWYYQSNNQGLAFMVPDKAQHYWGSYGLNTIGQKYLGNTVGSLTALTLGYLWEVKDSKTSLGTANGGVVGFSYKDLIADYIGVTSSLINKNNRVKMWLDYSTADEEIMLHFSLSI